MAALSFPLRNENAPRATLADFQRIADRHGIPVSRVRAIVQVEAAGRGFTNDGLIRVLYEPHIAYRVSSGVARSHLVKAGLAWKGWKPGRYPKTQLARHEQIRRAAGIAGDAGFKAASYGLPQVLGSNHRMVGFPASAESMVAYMLRGELEQLDVMFRFIDASGAIKHLKGRRANYSGFARIYNGPAHAKNRYAERLQAAEDMFSRGGTAMPHPGAARAPDPSVKEAQSLLLNLGYAAGPPDGINGSQTQAAVLAFQKTHPDLANDGRIGPHTLAALRKAVEAKEARDSALTGQLTTVAVGGGAVAVTAVSGMPWWAVALIVVAGIGIVGALSWWLWRTYRPEFEQAANIAKGKVVEVKEWAERLADGDLQGEQT